MFDSYQVYKQRIALDLKNLSVCSHLLSRLALRCVLGMIFVVEPLYHFGHNLFDGLFKKQFGPVCQDSKGPFDQIVLVRSGEKIRSGVSI